MASIWKNTYQLSSVADTWIYNDAVVAIWAITVRQNQFWDCPLPVQHCLRYRVREVEHDKLQQQTDRH